MWVLLIISYVQDLAFWPDSFSVSPLPGQKCLSLIINHVLHYKLKSCCPLGDLSLVLTPPINKQSQTIKIAQLFILVFKCSFSLPALPLPTPLRSFFSQEKSSTLSLQEPCLFVLLLFIFSLKLTKDPLPAVQSEGSLTLRLTFQVFVNDCLHSITKEKFINLTKRK